MLYKTHIAQLRDPDTREPISLYRMRKAIRETQETGDPRATHGELVDDILETLNKLIGGCGVEAMHVDGVWIDHYYGDIAALYVNMGDTYVTTFVFDTEKGILYCCDWGTWYETSKYYK